MRAASFGFGRGEVLLILVVVFILVGAGLGVGRLGDFLKGFGKGVKELKQPTEELTEEMMRAVNPGPITNSESRKALSGLVLWIAQGFGVGRIPVGPGTFGSFLGLLWFAILMLMASGSVGFGLFGLAAGIVLSVWLCGRGEEILGEQDPGSIVLDEVIAVPVCFISWIWIVYSRDGFLPEVGYFFSARTWPLTLAVLVLFRLFDI